MTYGQRLLDALPSLARAWRQAWRASRHQSYGNIRSRGTLLVARSHAGMAQGRQALNCM